MAFEPMTKGYFVLALWSLNLRSIGPLWFEPIPFGPEGIGLLLFEPIAFGPKGKGLKWLEPIAFGP